MTPELLAAILQFAVKFGIESAKEILAAHDASIDEAIAALDRAQKKSIADYIAADAAATAATLTPVPPPPTPPA